MFFNLLLFLMFALYVYGFYFDFLLENSFDLETNSLFLFYNEDIEIIDNIYSYKYIILSDHSRPNNFNLSVLIIDIDYEIEPTNFHSLRYFCRCQEIAIHFPSNLPIDQISSNN